LAIAVISGACASNPAIYLLACDGQVIGIIGIKEGIPFALEQ
jgi:hypothetical protein